LPLEKQTNHARMLVTVIVVNYNGGDLLRRCVEALQAQTFRDFHTVIVDNGSQDGSMQKLGSLPESFETVVIGKNIGFAGANNLAARKSAARWIATLNPDAIPESNWLEQLIAATKRHPAAVMFGSTQLNARDPSIFDGTGDAYHACGFAWRGNFGRSVTRLPPEGETFSPCAAAALYRREEFLLVDGFDERFFCYYEDIDLAFRLRLNGHRCIQVPAAVVHHFGSETSGRYSEFTQYHAARNRLWAFVKNMPGLLLPLLLPAHLAVHAAFMARAWSRGYGGAMLRGTRDMLKDIRTILADRRAVQKCRKISVAAAARMFTWSPVKLITRAPDIRRPG
jgi:N-acetylglucosaminyl-diphospho-decaprenol L-rhamnosyltransferase